jgi:hypothetical protein
MQAVADTLREHDRKVYSLRLMLPSWRILQLLGSACAADQKSPCFPAGKFSGATY